MARVSIGLEHQEVIDILNRHLEEKIGASKYKHYKVEVTKTYPDSAISEIRITFESEMRGIPSKGDL